MCVKYIFLHTRACTHTVQSCVIIIQCNTTDYSIDTEYFSDREEKGHALKAEAGQDNPSSLRGKIEVCVVKCLTLQTQHLRTASADWNFMILDTLPSVLSVTVLCNLAADSPFTMHLSFAVEDQS